MRCGLLRSMIPRRECLSVTWATVLTHSPNGDSHSDAAVNITVATSLRKKSINARRRHVLWQRQLRRTRRLQIILAMAELLMSSCFLLILGNPLPVRRTEHLPSDKVTISQRNKCKKQRLKRTVMVDKVAHLKQQRLDFSTDFHALFHRYSAAGFYWRVVVKRCVEIYRSRRFFRASYLPVQWSDGMFYD